VVGRWGAPWLGHKGRMSKYCGGKGNSGKSHGGGRNGALHFSLEGGGMGAKGEAAKEEEIEKSPK